MRHIYLSLMTYYEAQNRALKAKIILDRIEKYSDLDLYITSRKVGQGLVQRDLASWGFGSSRNNISKRKFESKGLRRGDKDKRSYQDELLICQRYGGQHSR